MAEVDGGVEIMGESAWMDVGSCCDVQSPLLMLRGGWGS